MTDDAGVPRQGDAPASSSSAATGASPSGAASPGEEPPGPSPAVRPPGRHASDASPVVPQPPVVPPPPPPTFTPLPPPESPADEEPPDRTRDAPEVPIEPTAPPAAFQPSDHETVLAGYAPGGPTAQAGQTGPDLDVPLTDTARLRQLATGQLLIVGRPETPVHAEGELDETEQRRVYSVVSVVLGVLGAIASLFVGWALPLSIGAIVFGVLGLRREEGARSAAFVGIGTGVVGVLFGAIWIGYYLIVFGAIPS